jgi:hypothetical protein
MIEDVISDKFSIYRNIFLNTAITVLPSAYNNNTSDLRSSTLRDLQVQLQIISRILKLSNKLVEIWCP